ncbi:hypothetical protein M758_9G080900 [Ceratodon purpureus]|nr:hypothetical protein M758_9G080900 [Ceratodon purpureus]
MTFVWISCCESREADSQELGRFAEGGNAYLQEEFFYKRRICGLKQCCKATSLPKSMSQSFDVASIGEI